MRRVGSYGGPSGVAGSERLKQRLSSTPGLHLLSSNSLAEAGFLAAVGDPQDERVIHRTFGAARNFYAIASNLKQVAKRGSWVTRKDPFAALVKETIILDEPVDTYQHCSDGEPAVLVQEVDGKHHSTPEVLDNGAGEGDVGVIPDVPSNDSQVVEVVELEEVIGTSSSSDYLSNASTFASLDTGNDIQQDTHVVDSEIASKLLTCPVDLSWHETRSQCSLVGAGLDQKEIEPVEVSAAANTPPFGRSGNQDGESRLLGSHLAAGELQAAVSHLETEPPSIALAEADCSRSTSPISAGQDLLTSRPGKCEADTADNVDILGDEKSPVLETCAGLEKSENGPSENMAAVEIQSCWRGSQKRKHFKQVKGRVVFLQSLVRRNQEFKLYHKTSQAAIVLQKYWRAFQSIQALKRLKTELGLRKRRRINNAAIVVQKHWRSAQSRHLLDNLRKERDVGVQRRNDRAAVVVQKHWRARRGRCLGKHLKMEQVAREQQRIGDAAVVLQKHWRAQRERLFVKHLKIEQAMKEQQRIDNAAIVLQKYWRARQSRCLMKHLRIEQLEKEIQRINDAALVLQKYWRGHQGRCFVKHLRMELVVREKERMVNAATVLQKHWRAQQGRCLVNIVREQQRIDNATVVLQKHWRAKQGRFLVGHLRMEQVAREQQRTDDAAIVLQKHWRAQQGRSYVKHLKLEQVAMEQQRKIDHAAVAIQKHWRAQQGRCLVEQLRMEHVTRVQQKLKDAAIVLQKHWRAQRSRALVEQMRMEQLVRQQQMDHAAVVLQKHWRGRQSRCLVKDLKEKTQIVNNAVIVVQKCWRAQQSRLTVKRLRMELAARERHRASAATTLQKHWRARQSMLLLTHMKLDEAVREQQTLDDAAIVAQKHWRGQHSWLLVKHLKREQALRELERVVNAAVVLQKYWRGFQSRQVVKFLYTERAEREERAASCIQARVRGNATRVKFKAALTIQKAWQLYWSARLTISAVSIDHHLFPSSTIAQKRKILAIIVLQAYARGFVVRRRLGQVLMPKSANVSLQPDQAGNETLTETEGPLVTSPSSSIVQDVDAGVRSVDQRHISSDRWQELECAPITSQQRDLSASLGLDDEFSAASGDVQVQKNGGEEDWNYVPVDELDECLDTCLAALRPLPYSGSQHCLPGLDVPEKFDQNVENKRNADRVSTSYTELSTNTCEIVQQVPRTWSGIGEAGNKPSHPIKSASDASRMQSDHVMSQATLTGPTDHLEISCRPVHETGAQQMEDPLQGASLGRQTSKQNEQRLKQFAQVFLLQRHIALQQQRAQAAPPFPPPLSSGSERPSHLVTQPLENERDDQREAAVQITSTPTEAPGSQVEGRRAEEHHVVCDIVDPDTDEQIARRHSQACQNSGSKQIIERPRPDVVLDMVLLLRRIEEEYGTSERDFEGESSTWCSSGCGDIEEGIPLLDRNSSSMRRQSSVAKFANAVNIKHISIPDVNAVLLVFIAMVVYTRTVCKGLFFGARQTHRRP